MSETVGYFDVLDGMFAIVSKTFWDAHPGEMDGDGLDEDTSNLLPSGFYEVAESAFEHEFSTDEEAIAALEAAGFERGKFRFSA